MSGSESSNHLEVSASNIEIGTLENARINQLPMNQRNIITQVGYTTPGMEDGGMKMNGQAQEAIDYSIDGTSSNNNLFGGESTSQAQLIDPDSVQEVKLEAENASAQNQ